MSETMEADLILEFTERDLQGSVPERFERVVRRFRQRPAVIHGSQVMTYGELNAAANRIAHWLLERGQDQRAPVAVMLDDGPPMIAAMLGILKAGRAYCALSPSLPADRIALVVQDLQTRLVLTDAAHRPQAVQLTGDGRQVVATETAALEYPETDPGLELPSQTLSFVRYTSGTTGQPKPVSRSHWYVLNRTWLEIEFHGSRADDVVSMVFSVTGGATVSDLYLGLLTGAAVCLYDVKREGLEGLADWIVRNSLTRLHLPATMLRSWLDMLPDDLVFPSLRNVRPSFRLYCRDVARLWSHLPAGATISHSLSASETGPVCRMMLRRDTVLDGEVVPVGWPIPGVEIQLVDEIGAPVAPGEVGEIVVTSPFVSAGRGPVPGPPPGEFPADPADGHWPSHHLGDLGRLRPDGCLEWVGRKDLQVKIRGYRVEMEEVEVALERLDAVKQAVVVAGDDPAGEKWLVAYVVPAASGRITVRELRYGLSRWLPAYAIPARFVFLDSLPLLPRGKVDRRALPPPGTGRPDLGTPYAPPRTPAEETLAAIWSHVLGLERVGIHDHFVDLGGDSISGARMMAQVHHELGRNLPLAVLLRAPTIALLAEELERPGSSSDWETLVPLQTGAGRLPLFCVHGADGGVLGYADLARHLGTDQPVYGLQAAGLDGVTAPDGSIEEMAARYVEAVRRVQPRGPYHLAGYCIGGMVTYEMACQLETLGEQVGLLAIVEGAAPAHLHARMPFLHPRRLRAMWRSLPLWVQDYGSMGASGVWRRVQGRVARWRRPLRPGAAGTAEGQAAYDGPAELATLPEQQGRLRQVHRQARRRYQPRPYGGHVVLFQARTQSISKVVLGSMDPEWGWGALAAGGVEVRVVEGSHRNVHLEPHVSSLAEALNGSLGAGGGRI